MKVYRIHLTSWTASFRYPNMISGYQPTLTTPPLSTINGLISAAKGDYFVASKEKIGYVLQYKAKTTDLETIYQMGQRLTQIKSNVIQREFLSDVDLYLYTDSAEITECFKFPVYQLLLGRSGDLATVKSITEIEITEKEKLSDLKGTIIPFKKYKLAAPMQALPTSFSNTIPRRNYGTQPYFILDWNYRQRDEIKAKGIHDMIDNKTNWDVYWQEF
ncbi:MAG: type I-B CRISPR-associated protein Cas5 [Candidatus Cloacimonetes bacterium]|nr:type I-B CRISPR-associated protein Cas5 [Candidatus Cloacimonadota bacterium]MBL7086896.1 type I-B CRISPR-associated protein Cas5 [Candidatus Cloacimonadota bacterium]